MKCLCLAYLQGASPTIYDIRQVGELLLLNSVACLEYHINTVDKFFDNRIIPIKILLI
jgi:hypothetical protein